MYSVNISIAGFNLKIKAFDTIEKENILKAYGTFVTNKQKGIPVIIQTNNFIPPVVPFRQKFSLGDNWHISRYKKDYCVELKNIEQDKMYTTNLAVFRPDFLSGSTYVCQRPQKSRVYSFTYPIDQIFFMYILSLHKGILVHGCGLKYNGKGLLFLGPSGAGKSTVGKIFSQNRKAMVLNDDRIIIRKEEDKFFMYGTPWHGTLSDCSPEKVELKRVCFLKKSFDNNITKLPLSESISRLTALTFLPYYDRKFTSTAFSTITQLARKNIFFELSFIPDSRIIDLIAHGIL
jgi:hypothetical protein